MSAIFKHAKGHIAKLKLMQQYIKRGYYIYDECNQGPIDFIAVHPNGDIKLVECKAVSKRTDGSKIFRILKKSQRELNKNLLNKNIQIKVEHIDVDYEMENYNEMLAL